jgi:hypothetical protein
VAVRTVIVPGSQVTEELRAREEFEASCAEPVAAYLRLARNHRHDGAYRDGPVRGSSVERAVSTPMPASAVRGHPGYPKARVWQPVPPAQLFRPGRLWLLVVLMWSAYDLSHTADTG